jgi:hypothetical protein
MNAEGLRFTSTARAAFPVSISGACRDAGVVGDGLYSRTINRRIADQLCSCSGCFTTGVNNIAQERISSVNCAFLRADANT